MKSAGKPDHAVVQGHAGTSWFLPQTDRFQLPFPYSYAFSKAYAAISDTIRLQGIEIDEYSMGTGVGVGTVVGVGVGYGVAVGADVGTGVFVGAGVLVGTRVFVGTGTPVA